MAHKNTTHHDVNASDKLDPSVFSCEQLVQMVIDLWWQLDKHRPKANGEQELISIHRDIIEHEREAVTQDDHQLLTQIKGFTRGTTVSHRVGS